MEYINRLLHRSPNASASTSPEPPSGNETFKKATPEHEVKVNFAREFADAESYPSAVCPTTVITPAESNSISTASSFQSLTSTLSTKSSSGICVDSPSRSNDNSYSNLNDTGLDDLISACARIRLEDTTTFNADQSLGDVTFASATDELQLDRTVNITRSGTASPVPGNDTQTIDTHANETKIISSNSPSPYDLNRTWNSNANVSPADTSIVNKIDNNPALNTSAEQISPEYSTATDLHTHFSIKSPVNVINDEPVNSSEYLEALESNNLTNDSQVLTLPASSDCSNDNSEFKKPIAVDNPTVSENVLTGVPFEPLESTSFIETRFEFAVNPTPVVNEKSLETLSNLETINSLAIETGPEEVISEEATTKSTEELNTVPVLVNAEIIEFDFQGKTPNEFIEEVTKFDKISLDVNKETSERAADLDSTLLVDDINFTLSHEDLQEALTCEAEVKEDKNIITCPATEGLNLPNDYGDFTPQRQSTSLVTDILQKNIRTEEPFQNFDALDSKFFDGKNDPALDAPLDFDKLKLEAETIVKDIHNTTPELEKETFVPASPGLFRDPSQVDFFLEKTGNGRGDRLRSDSLFANFDPLALETSMLPQGNGASPPASNDEQNGEKETSLPNIITPKRNPAIAAIDRLLFYSPMTPDNIKSVESEKIEPVEKTVSSPVPVVDSAMAGELELVRSTVLQLEEQLEKQKHSYDKQLDEKDKKNKSLQDTINQLQKQLAQEIKNKDQIAVIVDEHEKSISRLVAEREKNRNDIDAEKAFLLEELAETKKHLEASEASFNDVHSKYEKMKQAMVLSNNNEATLRESLENNIEVMKGLQNRYEQIKLHAAARLDKANQDLEVMRKQHESEIIKLRAMLKKEELKCNSLTEMIDQKTKENKELTKILDEVIARVNPSDK
ncbi:uncharacterized protein LOC130669284 isoform X2 [Microplitis mediator]|uniref:uncharacterized protein LOC130669284 isoform X2 n=1 Tax=Microplitis mediator TaxID=375433 RepID=UPI00255605BE|nr:uncharacterized protein LOC130669284 isoform X2 [Microplitis mediator]